MRRLSLLCLGSGLALVALFESGCVVLPQGDAPIAITLTATPIPNSLKYNLAVEVPVSADGLLFRFSADDGACDPDHQDPTILSHGWTRYPGGHCRFGDGRGRCYEIPGRSVCADRFLVCTTAARVHNQDRCGWQLEGLDPHRDALRGPAGS